jgi:hypothetical protein
METIKILKKKRFTIIEINELLKENAIHCPDDLARTLNVMRKKKLIHSEFCEEKSAWVYWADKE